MHKENVGLKGKYDIMRNVFKIGLQDKLNRV
jgi:hypothetical protein